MSLELRRVILFTPRLAEMTAFYRDVIGLEVSGREEGWVDFAAGASAIALHAAGPQATGPQATGKSSIGARPPKIVFYAPDVAQARATLIKRGLTGAGKVKSANHFDMFDAKDPDGNRLQVSSRK